MSSILKNICYLILPEYFIITIFSVIASSLVISGRIDTFIILPIFSLSFAMIGFNTFNNIFDVDIDKINKPDRPIPKGVIKSKHVILLSFFSFFSAFLFSLLIDLYSVFLINIFIIMAFLYSLPKLRFKKYLFSSNIIGSVIYGAIPFLLVWRSVGGEIPFYFLLFFTLLIFCMAPIKDIEDVKGEKIHAVKTIPIFIGVKKTTNLVIFLFIVLNTMNLILILLKFIPLEYIYSVFLSYLIIYFLNIIYRKNIIKESNIITQSKLVTFTMIAVILIELSYGFVRVFLIAS